jgi:hypothetical protein
MTARRLVTFLGAPGLCVLLAYAGCAKGGDSPGTGNGGEGGDTSGTGGKGGSPARGGSGGSSSGGAVGTGGSAPGSGGSSGSGGGGAGGGSGGASGQGGGSPGTGGGGAGDGGPADTGRSDVATAGEAGTPPTGTKFSFFVTSLVAMRRLSKSQNGFGGDLRYGEADGLTGADKICTEIAESSLPGAGAKKWHAFLSAAAGPGGMPVNAIDRIGGGPWYDRMGRLLAMTKADLLQIRPRGADPAIINDLPNEFGIGNHRPDPTMPAVDNHHVLTGSDAMGKLYGPTSTCMSWTSAARTIGRPRIGFSWPLQNRQNWISGQDEGGCGAGVNQGETGGSDPSNPIVGSGGGYGGIYCFADTP